MKQLPPARAAALARPGVLARHPAALARPSGGAYKKTQKTPLTFEEKNQALLAVLNKGINPLFPIAVRLHDDDTPNNSRIAVTRLTLKQVLPARSAALARSSRVLARPSGGPYKKSRCKPIPLL
jgi:hypothetical protein